MIRYLKYIKRYIEIIYKIYEWNAILVAQTYTMIITFLKSFEELISVNLYQSQISARIRAQWKMSHIDNDPSLNGSALLLMIHSFSSAILAW